MMFAGMIRINNSHQTDQDTQCHRCAGRTGGSNTASAAGGSRRRSFRRPGYMRPEQLSQVDCAEGLTSKKPRDSDSSGPSTYEKHQESTVQLPSSPCEKWLKEAFMKDSCLNSHNSSKTLCLDDTQIVLQREETSTIPTRDVFNSSFSFIQQSLEVSDLFDIATSEPSAFHPKETSRSTLFSQRKSEPSHTLKPGYVFINNDSLSQSQISSVPINQSGSELLTLAQHPCSIGQSVKPKGLLLDREPWLVDLDMPWHNSDSQTSSSMTSDFKEPTQDSDSGSLDTEVTSSLSVDSLDSTSASSVTSGYDSTTPSSDQSQDGLMRKYEEVLQDCLQNNRTNTKIESIMMKLQRLQRKAVLDDDYDAAERFGKKLEELRRERATLKPGLPSTHPKISGYLERLRASVRSALQRTDAENRQNGELTEDQESSSSSQSRLQTREQLIQEKQRIQKEMCELQRRLEELQEQSRAVEQRLRQEVEGVEGPVVRGSDRDQLQLMGRALQDMLTSEHRTRICVSPPAEMIRLQEQEQSLSLSIKEATAKVVMSQRLAGSLRRKVSESDTQLLALHEAKLTALSGNDFTGAKELKAEIRNVYSERDRLEGLVRKLQTLSTGSAQDLTRMKEQHQQLKLDLQQREAQYEHSLKENTLKYVELLEDRLHSCGSPALEHIWEADLEACHLLLKGLQQRTASVSDDLPSIPQSRSYAAEEEADCAMLTALGGRWCPEADLQNSEFTKKLEAFLFCLEDGHSEDLCGEASELTERCELISDRLHHLEEQLHTAIENQDQDLTLSLEKEVQEVKATLQAMMSQLKEEEEQEDDEEDEDKYCDVEEEHIEDEDEEEHYFSDSWEI